MSRFIFSLRPAAILIAVALLHFSFRADAALANCWHIPDNTSDLRTDSPVEFGNRHLESHVGQNTYIQSGAVLPFAHENRNR
jgi:hypothetical protein